MMLFNTITTNAF